MMTSPFLSGVLMAWASVQIALGVFFLLAERLGRREPEYLVFGLLCFAISAETGAVAVVYAADSLSEWSFGVMAAHAGAIAANALNTHFVLRYLGLRSWRRVAYAIYPLAALFEVVNALGHWFTDEPRRLDPVNVLGAVIVQYTRSPAPMAIAFYGLTALALGGASVALARAYLAGRREALSTLVGSVVVTGCSVNDMLTIAGWAHSPYLLPHGFLIYAFAVASTLLLRYRAAAGELVQAASHLEERTQELRHSYAELKLVQDELVKKQQLAAVGELAAAIAHEVRNPLAVIVNAVAGLRRPAVGTEDRGMLLSIIDEETVRLNRLVTDLLRFARPVNIKRSLVSLTELLSRTHAVARTDHEVTLEMQGVDEHAHVYADPNLLRLVFDNLVENACQAMPGGGSVRFLVRPAELEGAPAVQVDIKDSGHGMEEQVLERATDPFFTTRPSGTGLGLPIVGRIVEAHGGKLTIDSTPGDGTTATVLLPVSSPSEGFPESGTSALQASLARSG